MHVKICGLTTTDDALAAARCGADFVGMILAPSTRRVSLTTAEGIARALPSDVRPVLVFRDAPLDEVLGSLEIIGRADVQLHGREPVAYLDELLRRRPETRLLRAWEVRAAAHDHELTEYLSEAGNAGVRIETVIVDVPKGAPHPGFERLAAVARLCTAASFEVWCAGGLTPENVALAAASGPYAGVDVAGGVELRPGVKDHAAMTRFVQAARLDAARG